MNYKKIISYFFSFCFIMAGIAMITNGHLIWGSLSILGGLLFVDKIQNLIGSYIGTVKSLYYYIVGTILFFVGVVNAPSCSFISGIVTDNKLNINVTCNKENLVLSINNEVYKTKNGNNIYSFTLQTGESVFIISGATINHTVKAIYEDDKMKADKIKAQEKVAKDLEIEKQNKEKKDEEYKKSPQFIKDYVLGVYNNSSNVSTLRQMCQNSVKERLKAPKGAEFQDRIEMPTKIVNDNEIRMQGYVDSQNSFGANIRAKFQCKAKPFSGDMYIFETDIE